MGKSSVLRALTRARPKVGDYAFTTLHPHVGVVEYADFEQISIVDFPGILPDLTAGFGTRFFHHLADCRLLVFVVDVGSRADAYEQFESTLAALRFYDPGLVSGRKPSLVLANKVDLVPSAQSLADRLRQLRRRPHVPPVVPFSAEKKINLKKFLTVLRDSYYKCV